METATTAPSGVGRLVVRLLGVCCALPLLLIVVLTFLDVFARYVFSSPIRGSVEIVQFAMALVIFAALPLVTRQRDHVTVSLVDGWFARREWTASKQRFCDLVSLAALVLLTRQLWLAAGDYVSIGTRTAVLSWPFAPLAYALCAFSALSAIIVAGQILRPTAAPPMKHPTP